MVGQNLNPTKWGGGGKTGGKTDPSLGIGESKRSSQLKKGSKAPSIPTLIRIGIPPPPGRESSGESYQHSGNS